jgi:hypothetical protein
VEYFDLSTTFLCYLMMDHCMEWILTYKWIWPLLTPCRYTRLLMLMWMLYGPMIYITPSLSGPDNLGPWYFNLCWPFLQVHEFTHADVRRMDLVYVPPPPHLVPIERPVSFKFSMVLPRNDIRPPDPSIEETFSILLLPLGHREPKFRVPNPVIAIGKVSEMGSFCVGKLLICMRNAQRFLGH